MFISPPIWAVLGMLGRTLFAAIAAVSLHTPVQAQTYVDGRDLIALHYDHAPDLDDGHSAAAGYTMSTVLGFDPIVVGGAYGDGNKDRFISSSIPLMNRIWGSGWLDAHNDWDSSVRQAADEWISTISSGGKVYVAEGGQSDFTADVIRRIKTSENIEKSSVVVVQHSRWNEDQSNQNDLNYVKQQATYFKIHDGNHVNDTADLNNKSASFVSKASNSQFALQWNSAFDYLNPNNHKLDFSDTVELLHILGIGKNQIATVDDFADLYLSGAEIAQRLPEEPTEADDNSTNESDSSIEQVASGTSFTVDLAEDQVASLGAGVKTWARKTQNGQSGYRLEPDTRVTHSDPLIRGVNFWDDPSNSTPYIEYNITAPAGGRYRVEVQALSTGTEDNGAHLWLNGQWVLNKVQWCTGKGSWTYTSALRLTTNHCGIAGTAEVTLNAGSNVMRVGAREDGLFVSKVRFTLLNNSSVIADVPVTDADQNDEIAPPATAESDGPNGTDHKAIRVSWPRSPEEENIEHYQVWFSRDEIFLNSRAVAQVENPPVEFDPEHIFTLADLAISATDGGCFWAVAVAATQASGTSDPACFNMTPAEELEDDAPVATVITGQRVESTVVASVEQLPYAEQCVSVDRILNQSQNKYDLRCQSPREDCDYLTGDWYCSSHKICSATATELRSARARYRQKCAQPREDCDPDGAGGWVCVSIKIN